MRNGVEVVVSVETDDLTDQNSAEAGDGAREGDDRLKPCDTDESTVASPATDAATEGPDDGTHSAEPRAAHGDKAGLPWMRILAFGLLPGLAIILAMAAGFAKWQDASSRAAETARSESMQAAKDSTIALLAYRPDTVDKELDAARDRLTGSFRESYASLTRNVVIPGAKQRQISAAVSVPAVASVSASADHAVVLVFVNQTITIGTDAPSATASSVKVTLERMDGRWMISDFTPV